MMSVNPITLALESYIPVIVAIKHKPTDLHLKLMLEGKTTVYLSQLQISLN